MAAVFFYMHSGMYGMYALQESVRQMRGTAPGQIPGAKISVCHGVGGMFAASGTIIMSNEAPQPVSRLLLMNREIFSICRLQSLIATKTRKQSRAWRLR